MLRGVVAPTRLRLRLHTNHHPHRTSSPQPGSSFVPFYPRSSSSSSSSSSISSTASRAKTRHPPPPPPPPPPRFTRRHILLCLAPALAVVPALALNSPEHSFSDSQAAKLHNFRFSLWPSRPPPEPQPAPYIHSTTFHPAPTLPMSSPPASAFPPGRPETLTKEQEAKLKELWTASLQVFGSAGDLASIPAEPVEGVTAPANDDASSEQTPSESTSTASETPKKKSKSSGGVRGFLSRKDKKADPNGGTQTNPATSAPAGHTTPVPGSAVDTAPNVTIDHADDKYGHGKEFRAALASQTPAELREAFWSMTKCDNPDGLLLRFLRARKWDVDKALVMMVATMKWRAKEMDVEDVVRRGELGAIKEGDEGFMKQLRMGKSFLHGVDKDGRPICYIRVKLHRAGDQSEQSLEKYTILVMETARLMLRKPVDTAAVVFDMTDFGMANMDYTPVKFMIKCFEAHYPESLGICLVHKAPWIFQGIWNIIKGWLDPVVAQKIHFTKTMEDLEAFIPKSQIITSLGGDEDWDYKYVEPAEGEDAALEDTEALKPLQAEREKQVEHYEELTRKWIKAETGSEENEKVKSERMKASEVLEVGYWKLDKYLRGRTLYDRCGIVHEDGKLDFYPKSAEKAEAASEAN